MSSDTERPAPWQGLKDVRDRLLRPAVGFEHPMEVLRDPLLNREGKRAMLSSWASDASAVENWPTLRWLFGTPRPVPVAEVLDALSMLDHRGGLKIETPGASSSPRSAIADRREDKGELPTA